MFLRQGCGEIRDGFDDDFYAWWGRQVPSFEQLPYEGLYFHGDPEMILPLGGVWGEIGEF